ncbi:MAG: helix-turn-helix domain-containing protein [Actinomycetota bacterium]|jgi:excisionase family DNA binding protein|nr:helix-turn-helix domain-containing protein [Actinomycetota bacterium]MED5277428.1 helix-turn-helix domain-containing protein [Actinomycetota bacterium]|tara:strand:+ start:2146 stop:2376 length:231 start_codon:yes stop_codon:yes gene_type:complete
MDTDSSVSKSQVQWMSSNEAAQRLGVTTATLYRFIDEGRLPAYRMGRVIRLKESEVEDFETTCRIKPGSLSHLLQE